MRYLIASVVFILLFSVSVFAVVNLAYLYEFVDVSTPVIKETVVPAGCKMVYNATLDSSKEVCNKEYINKEITGWRVDSVNTGRIVGVVADERTYWGSANIKGGKASVWNVPIGNRNMEEYGACRAYEVEKGVCRVIG